MTLQSTDKVSTREKLAYGMGCFGQNLAYYFISNFIFFFYTDVFYILPAAAGTILLITKIWDGINDPIMGIIVDRTRSRWGKFRPWLLFTPILFVPISILCFSAPDLTYTGKIIWAYATFIFFDITYTASDVPFWAMSSAITSDPVERNSVVVYPRFIATIAIALATVGTVPLIHFFQNPDHPDRGYQLTALFYGIITVVCFAFTFFFVKERVKTGNDTEHASKKDVFTTLLKNKPLIILIVSGLFVNMATGAKLSTLIYYAKYNLNNEMLNPLVAGINIPFILAGIVITPYIAKRFGKKMTYIILLGLFVIGSLGFYLSGWDNLVLILMWSCVSSLGMAAPLVLQTSMLADTIEYAQLKTGKRQEGLIFSTQTFMVKLSSALTSWITGIILTATGFAANQIQNQRALAGIHSIISLLPLICAAIAIVPMVFYPLTERFHKEIMTQLRQRTEESE
ncbi:MAG: MFS transporter [Sphaerochaetaceae bacterium]